MAFTTDLRYALRSLRAHPFHAIVAAGSLAIGVSTVTGIVTLRDASRNLTPVFPNAERVVAFSRRTVDQQLGRFGGVNREVTLRASRESKSLAAVGAWTYRSAGLRLEERTVSVYGFAVSGSLPRILGLKPALGRLFTDEDGYPGGPNVVVLAHSHWQSQFSGDSTVIGRSYVINGVAHTIVGVLPPRAEVGGEGIKFWSARSLERITSDTNSYIIGSIGLMKPGESIASVNQELGPMSALERRIRGPARVAGVVAEPLYEMFLLQVRGPMQILSVLGIIVAIIAATNFASLILARGMQRHVELGVRSALGASVGDLTRYLILECGLLGVAGGTVGAIFAPGVIALIGQAAEGMIPGWLHLTWTLPAAGAGILAAVLLGVFFGIAPALELARPASASGFLRAGASMLAGNKAQTTGRRRLVAAQVALATGTLVFVGVLFGSIQNFAAGSSDYEDPFLYLGAMQTFGGRVDTTWKLPTSRATLIQAARSADGSRGAAVSQEFYVGRQYISTVPAGTLQQYDIRNPRWLRVSDEYFETVRPKLVAGRYPTREELVRAEPVAVVTEEMLQLLGMESKTGWTIKLSATGAEASALVVGIAESPMTMGNATNSFPTAYTPLPPAEPARGYGQTLWVRNILTQRAAIKSITESLRRDAPNQTVLDLRSDVERARSEVRAFRQIAWLVLGVFALALGLAALGVYGIITFGAMARRKEMAIRTALGGSRAHLANVVTREATTHSAIGLVLGIAGGIATAAMLATRPVLFLIPPADIIGAAAISVGLVVFLSSIGPVLRVWRTDCADALRADG